MTLLYALIVQPLYWQASHGKIKQKLAFNYKTQHLSILDWVGICRLEFENISRDVNLLSLHSQLHKTDTLLYFWLIFVSNSPRWQVS